LSEALDKGTEMAARLKERYQKDVAPQIAKEFSIKNPMAIPRIEKVVVNMGMGEAIANAKILDTAADELRAITGQKPVVTKAKKSIASFKLRQGMPIGVVVTLRGDRMYEFLDRLMSVALRASETFAEYHQKHSMVEEITQSEFVSS
jgi:large subunit ribosomal protein L5